MAAIDILCNDFTPAGIRKNYLDNPEEAGRFAQVGRARNLEGVKTDDFVARMDKLGVNKVLVAAIATWSYREQRLLEHSTPEEVIEAIGGRTDRLYGLYGVNPMKAMKGVAEFERLVREHDFRGIHIHPHGYDMAPDHAYWFPYYAKCQELNVPVVISMGHTLDFMPIENGRPIRLDRAAIYFPDVAFVMTHTGWPWTEEAIAMAWKHPNVFLGTSAYAPKYWPQALVRFIDSRGRDKVMWGTDFPLIDHEESLRQIDDLGLRDESKRKFLHDNAARVFGFT